MPALSDDDFTLFGLAMQFNIDSGTLQRAYLSLQSEVHPDKHANSSDAARRLAMQWATRVNEGFERLKSPVARAAYLCELNGFPVDAESNTAMPAAFLIEQMEWREALDDAKHIDQIDALWDMVNRSRQQLLNNLRTQIDSDHDYQMAAASTRQLMFIDKFQINLERAAQRLED